MTDRRLPPEAREKMADALRERLGKERLHPRRWLIAALTFIALGLFGLRWHLRDAPPLPPVMLIAFDALADQPDAVVEAWLVAPGHPHARLETLDIEWSTATPTKTKTDSDGIARLPVGVRPVGSSDTVLASFIDPLGAYRRDDRATVINPPDGALVVVDMSELVADRDLDWLSGAVASAAVSEKAKGLDRSRTPLYVSGPADPAVYRAMRNWLRDQISRNALPPGPLLAEPADALVKRLSLRRPAGSVMPW